MLFGRNNENIKKNDYPLIVECDVKLIILEGKQVTINSYLSCYGGKNYHNCVFKFSLQKKGKENQTVSFDISKISKVCNMSVYNSK